MQVVQLIRLAEEHGADHARTDGRDFPPVAVVIVGRGDDAHHRDRIDRVHVLIGARGRF